MDKPKLSEEVNKFLKALNHPLRDEIDRLREIILSANIGLSENIKWNGPNFCFDGEDRITMKIHPPKQLQLIFHRGAKVLEQPVTKLISDKFEMLVWKTNDRAVATFKDDKDILARRAQLIEIINHWVRAAQNKKQI